MGVYPGVVSEDISEMRVWVVCGLVDRSCACGGDSLDLVCGRFVGIASEAPNTPSKSANVKVYTTSRCN